MIVVYLILIVVIALNAFLINLCKNLLKRITALEESQSKGVDVDDQWIVDRLDSLQERVGKSEDSLNKLWKALRASTNRKPQANRKKPTDK